MKKENCPKDLEQLQSISKEKVWHIIQAQGLQGTAAH